MIENKLDRVIELLETLVKRTALSPEVEKTVAPAKAAEAKPEPSKTVDDILDGIVETVTPAAQAEAPAPKKEEPKKLTKEALGEVIRAVVAEHGAEKVKKVIAKFGVERASLAPEAKWPEIVEAVKAVK